MAEWAYVVKPGKPILSDQEIANKIRCRLEHPVEGDTYPELVDRLHEFYVMEARRVLPLLKDDQARELLERLIRVHGQSSEVNEV